MLCILHDLTDVMSSLVFYRTTISIRTPVLNLRPERKLLRKRKLNVCLKVLIVRSDRNYFGLRARESSTIYRPWRTQSTASATFGSVSMTEAAMQFGKVTSMLFQVKFSMQYIMGLLEVLCRYGQSHTPLPSYGQSSNGSKCRVFQPVIFLFMKVCNEQGGIMSSHCHT